MAAVPLPAVSDVEPATGGHEPDRITTCTYKRDPLDRLAVIRRAGFDLTGLEILLLQERGLSYDVVPSDQVLGARGRE